MSDRDSILRGLRTRLAIWESKIDDLLEAAEHGPDESRDRYAGKVQELRDRLESARIKVERVRRASENRLEETRRECESALTGLQESWDSAILRLMSDDGARER